MQFVIVTPFFGDVTDTKNYYPIGKENAVPGYYKTDWKDIICEMTVSDSGVALHKYTFPKQGGRVAIDFSNDGLSAEFPERFRGIVSKEAFHVTSDGKVCFSGVFSGIKLYFVAEIQGADVTLMQDDMCAVFDFSGEEAQLKLTYSTLDFASAMQTIDAEVRSFDAVKEAASSIWKQYLSKIELNTQDEALKEKFYSNFYHTLIKPVDMTGEKVLGVSDKLVTDLATLWDQYKTQLPLVMLLYPDMGKKVADCIVNISRTMQKIPCSLGMSDIFPCEEQAKMLGVLVLLDAYYNGLISKEEIDECVKREFEREDFKSFMEEGVFERYTHIIDTTDACLYTAKITEDSDLKTKLLKLAENWVKAFDADGLMSKKSPYYEGDRYTYSFRPQANMADRIAFAGGVQQFTDMLDSFFGFNGESLKQITDMDAYEKLEAAQHHRFEGFNNECDMETPYSYIYVNRHDRLCEILHACVKDSFGLGLNGLPGNNDSGGLSSCFMWNVLGLFPLSGSGYFLLGAPQVEGAVFHLSGEKTLCIETKNFLPDENIYVEKILWNGEEITDYKLSVLEVLKGGTLTFYMKKA